MEHNFLIAALIILSVVLFKIFWKKDIHKINQAALDKYLKSALSNDEIGRSYERYIGYLYETEGHFVNYDGAVKGHADLGRDLVVWYQNEVRIVQTKYWAKYKVIREKHILQLYGSMAYYKLTSKTKKPTIKAVFYTTAQYSDVAKKVAKVLGVELKNEVFDRSYPRIKCKRDMTTTGENIYLLPFDQGYDKVNIKPRNGDFYVHTVQEAVSRGFFYDTKNKNAA